jgi:hypothetical protein
LVGSDPNKLFSVVGGSKGNYCSEEGKGSISVVAKQFDERVVAVATYFKNDGLEQLDEVLDCLTTLGRKVESLEKVLVQIGLGKDEDQVVVLRGVGEE